MAEFQDFEIDQDFNAVAPMSGEFSNLPVGDYKFIVKHLEQKASSKNNAMIVATLEVAEVINAPGIENPESLIGSKAWNNYSLMPKAIGRLKQLMVACGANLDKFRAGELLEAVFIGTVVHSQGEAKVGADGQPMEAKTFANVVNERPLDGEAAVVVEEPPVAKAPPPATKKATTNGAARKA